MAYSSLERDVLFLWIPALDGNRSLLGLRIRFKHVNFVISLMRQCFFNSHNDYKNKSYI